MPDLGQVIGTLLTSLAHARRMADEESVAIAEYYRTNPLLQGMSLPRIRVPELSIELPVLIDGHDEGEPNTPQDPQEIYKAIADELELASKREGIKLSEGFKKNFERDANIELGKLSETEVSKGNFLREGVVHAIDLAFAKNAKREKGKRLTQEQQQNIASDLRQKAANVALKKIGTPPKINASVVTSEVKEKAGPGNVVNLKLVLREEGLEWSVYNNPDGTVTRKLTPE